MAETRLNMPVKVVKTPANRRPTGSPESSICNRILSTKRSTKTVTVTEVLVLFAIFMVVHIEDSSKELIGWAGFVLPVAI